LATDLQTRDEATAGTSITAPVLVVEDWPQMRQIMAFALQDAGLPVESAVDGYDAVERARTRRPSLVVLDLGLPGMDGFQVADILREAYGNELPILVVTGDRLASERARQVGAYNYLKKPFDLEDLVARVHDGLERAGGSQQPFVPR